jgi:uncharacterized protein YneF (UPF0154 family)
MTIMKYKILIILAIFFYLALYSFASTKEISMKELFKNPPYEYRMLQIIHHYYDKDLAKNYDALGYGGVVANVSFDNYLESEEAWDKFLDCMNSFREKGMVFWIYDERGYPSGKAGGLTLRDHPEYEALGVLFAKTEGKGTIRHKMPVGEKILEPISVIAVPVYDNNYDLSRKIDLTDKVKKGQNEISWATPDGKWCIMSFNLGYMYEGTHCVVNYSDPLPYINIMDRNAVARFIELTHEAYKERCGSALKDYVKAFFTDEPSLMTLYLKKQDGLLPPIPWCWDFAEQFKSRYGYDILPELAHLFVNIDEKTPYIRLHFWKVVSELIEENFYKQIQDWCQVNGTASSGHALCEEQIFWHSAFEGDLYRDLRRMDIPGIDMLSSNPTQLARSRQIPVPKFVSSVTHLANRELCMSETSSHVQTVNKLPCSFEQRIGTINYQYVLGLTCITSYYGLKEFDLEKGELNIFNDHIGRLGVMLTNGKHIADIAVFYPIHSFWEAYIPTGDIAYANPFGEKAQKINTEFGAVSLELLANQRDFDYIDDQVILESEIREGSLNVAGESFKCVVLPNAYVMPLGVYNKLDKFVNSGGSLIALGGLPQIGMKEDETKSVKEISMRLSKSDRVKIVNGIDDVIKAVNEFTTPDLMLNKPCGELFYLHRQNDGKDIYFISNSLDESISREITINCTGKVSLWHPTTGEIKTINAENKDNNTIIKLDLKAFEGIFIVFE